jgi:hypothetical protein
VHCNNGASSTIARWFPSRSQRRWREGKRGEGGGGAREEEAKVRANSRGGFMERGEPGLAGLALKSDMEHASCVFAFGKEDNRVEGTTSVERKRRERGPESGPRRIFLTNYKNRKK